MSPDRPRTLPVSTKYALSGCVFFIILNGFSLKALSDRQRDRETTLQLKKDVEELRTELWTVRKLAEQAGQPPAPAPPTAVE